MEYFVLLEQGFWFIMSIVGFVLAICCIVWLYETTKATQATAEKMATLVKLAQKWDKRLEAERAEYEMFLKSGDTAKHE